MKEPKLTDEDDGDTLDDEIEDEPKLTDDDDGDTPSIEDSFGASSLGVKECCDDSEQQADQSGWDQFSNKAREDWDREFDYLTGIDQYFTPDTGADDIEQNYYMDIHDDHHFVYHSFFYLFTPPLFRRNKLH